MMGGHKARILILLLCLCLSACLSNNQQTITTSDSDLYAVDPVFREFYNFLGGKDILGEAISPAQDDDGVFSQYVVNGLMMFDPQAPAARKFQLGALGTKFGIDSSGAADGAVAAPFEQLYDQLGGEVFVGKPLTGQVYNSEKNRSEQYFENLGFYQGPETEGVVRLLPYGAWMCDEECRSSTPTNAILALPTSTHSELIPTAPQKYSPTSPVLQPVLTPTPESTSVPETAHRWVLQVRASSQVVADNQPQEISLTIQRDGLPIQEAQANLLVELPGGAIQSTSFPPTNSEGAASLKIEPIQAVNGALIPYQVCITSQVGEEYCIRQSYLIWTTP